MAGDSADTETLVADAAGTPLVRLLAVDGVRIPRIEAGNRLTLSRFAWVRPLGDELIAETSLGGAAVILEDPRAAALLFGFGREQPVLDAAAAAGLAIGEALEVAAVLHAASVLVDPDQRRAEDEPPLAVWEFHDLLFHVRSRRGRHPNLVGGTYRFIERIPPAAAVPLARWTESVELERPDHERLQHEDPPLARVQAARRSIRDYGHRPITLAELSEFLYRVGSVEDLLVQRLPPRAAADSIEFAVRPYPSGGALYELELYPAVRSCEGLAPGLYHYAADRHRLELVSVGSKPLDQLTAGAAAATASEHESMQVLIVITARMGRIAWKYESLAYALVLKHVGVVLQTMYLAATAMGLAPCAIGTGESDLFAQASGIDYYEESAVGEFMLGSRPSPGPLTGRSAGTSEQSVSGQEPF